jgi:hypothetical protein
MARMSAAQLDNGPGAGCEASAQLHPVALRRTAPLEFGHFLGSPPEFRRGTAALRQRGWSEECDKNLFVRFVERTRFGSTERSIGRFCNS